MANLTSEFNLQNVKCAGCVGKIETKLGTIPGVSSARVNLLEKTLRVEYQTKILDQDIIDAVASIGFGASLGTVVDVKSNLWLICGLPLLLGFILMTLGMSHHFMPDLATREGQLFVSGIALLTLIVILLTGKTIFKSGISGIFHINFNMHSLITLGVGSAWLYSTGIIVAANFHIQSDQSFMYFDSALVIIGLINLGAYFEDKAKSNTTKAIKGLIGLQPNETTIIVDGQDKVINTNLLRTEYVVRVKPGERIAADGVVCYGDGYVDESMLTGEPLAIHKQSGDKVIAGSINTSGAFNFQVSGIGSNTLLAEIIELVKSAQMSKPALAKLADQVARIFVPVIMLVAVVCALGWLILGPEPRFTHSISVFMTILIIACPCSVGLAIPVALMVGIGKSASKGVLIRDASCLNQISHLNYVLLDKTGTITEGKPQVIDYKIVDEMRSDELLSVIKAMENLSEHPLGKAICGYQPQIIPASDVTNFASISGSGVSARVNGHNYFLGSRKFVVAQASSSEIPLHEDNHFTQVFLGDNQRILARLDLSDVIKSDSAAAISTLHSQGIMVAMVTGDNTLNAEYIAKQVNVDKVYAECKPQDKIKIVKDLQAQGNIVAFVGDGINDAPSLIQANVGIAIGGGTDIAMQSASITLMRPSLIGITEAIRIGRAINQNMRQNLFGSFVYNSLAVLIAAGALYPIFGILLNPIIASLAMSASSITVIGNALRLRSL